MPYSRKAVVRLPMTAVAAGIVLLSSVWLITGARADGALAVGQCDRFGYSYRQSSAEEAGHVAFRGCAAEGDSSCRVVLNVEGSCYAFAVDGYNRCGPRGWGYAGSLHEAREYARSYCHQQGGHECTIKVEMCDR